MCRNFTTLESSLIIGLIFAILASNNIKVLGTAIKPGIRYDDADICQTAVCKSSSFDILSKLNTTVNPCDDFYEFACGGFMEKTVIPDDKTDVGTFTLIEDKLQLQLREVLSEDILADDDKFQKLPKLLYKACMDTDAIEQLGTSPIVDIVEKIGGWPVIRKEKWNEDDQWSWEKQIIDLYYKGIDTNYLISFSIQPDMMNSTKRMLCFDQAPLGFNGVYLEKGIDNNTQVKAYLDFMIDIAVLFGADRQRAETELTRCLGFEIELAKISVKPENRSNPIDIYHIYTLKDSQTKYPFFNWLNYVNALLPKEVRVTEDEEVNVAVPEYFKKLGTLLAKTDQRVIANYIMWRVHYRVILELPEKFRSRHEQLRNYVLGNVTRVPRWTECITTVTDSLQIAVDSLYVRKHFKNESKNIAIEMVSNVRSAFNSTLSKLSWMDDKTRNTSQKRLESMATYIGYPDEMLDNQILNEYYNETEVDTNYLKAMLSINFINNMRKLKKLRKPIDETEWIYHARSAIVDSFYSSKNYIQFSAGNFQGNFFNAQQPQYLNYGAIGWVIGHEITHGFDFESKGYGLNDNEFWDSSTKSWYLNRTQCIIDQYAGYVDQLTGEHLNGTNTQGENIPDNGGIQLSYLAYKEWVVKNGAEKRLIGLENYSPEQMFWISGAQMWCTKYRKESLRMQILDATYPPYHFRVLGTFSNSENFAKDFNCPVNSRMNPKKKCEVW